MEKVDLILTSAITASDGSVISKDAILKFDAEFEAGNTSIKIRPKIYRNRELFESGFTYTLISEETIPNEFIISITEDQYYSLTIKKLYELVEGHVNRLLGAQYFKLKTIII
jgi:hypothetical protein